MTDEVLKELWNIKDNIAKEHAYNIDSLVAYYKLKSKTRTETNTKSRSKEKAEQGHPADPDTALRFRGG